MSAFGSLGRALSVGHSWTLLFVVLSSQLWLRGHAEIKVKQALEAAVPV